MSDDKPRKTLSLKRNTSSSSADAPASVSRRNKRRVIRREDLPSNKLARTGTIKPKPKKPSKAKKPRRQPAKPKKTPPSDLRAQELNASLNAFAIWRERKPLALGVEKQVFQHIAAYKLSASKRVVQKLLRQHTRHPEYLQAIKHGSTRWNLDGTEAETIQAAEQEYAQQLAAKISK